MIEPYQWLLAHAAELGYKVENVGPASVDLELGHLITISKPRWFYKYRKNKIKTYTRDLPYEGMWIYPYEFHLCHTSNFITIPDNYIALLALRSSPSRQGLGHSYSGVFDPGFEGEGTLEIYTHLPIKIHRTQRVVQIMYIKLSEPTQEPYTGKYKGQRGPTEAYM